MTYEIVVILLLAVICFLLYKLYKIKYTEGGGRELIPESWKKDIMELGNDGGRELEVRFEDMKSRVSEIEKKIKKNERVVEKLVDELS